MNNVNVFDLGGTIGKISSGTDGGYSRSTLTLITPDDTDYESGVYTPAQTIRIYGSSNLIDLRNAIDNFLKENYGM